MSLPLFNRRRFGALALSTPAALLATAPARAHHGWSSFDQTRPLYLQGRVARVRWRNPHAELVLDVSGMSRDLAQVKSRALPDQSAPVDREALLKALSLPTRGDREWQIELAPLPRMNAWKVPEIQAGDSVGVIGFSFAGERGDPILRVEYLLMGDQAYGLRSSPV
jgi:hypothetical protein